MKNKFFALTVVLLSFAAAQAQTQQPTPPPVKRPALAKASSDEARKLVTVSMASSVTVEFAYVKEEE